MKQQGDVLRAGKVREGACSGRGAQLVTRTDVPHREEDPSPLRVVHRVDLEATDAKVPRCLDGGLRRAVPRQEDRGRPLVLEVERKLCFCVLWVERRGNPSGHGGSDEGARERHAVGHDNGRDRPGTKGRCPAHGGAQDPRQTHERFAEVAEGHGLEPLALVLAPFLWQPLLEAHRARRGSLPLLRLAQKDRLRERPRRHPPPPSLSLSLVLAQRRAGPFSSGVTFLGAPRFFVPLTTHFRSFAIWPPSVHSKIDLDAGWDDAGHGAWSTEEAGGGGQRRPPACAATRPREVLRVLPPRVPQREAQGRQGTDVHRVYCQPKPQDTPA